MNRNQVSSKDSAKKTNWTHIERRAVVLILLVGIGVLLYGFISFQIGYGNADLGQNIRWLNAEYNLTLGDMNLGGEILTSTTMYRKGMLMMHEATLIILFGAFTIGLSIAHIDSAIIKLNKLEEQKNGRS